MGSDQTFQERKATMQTQDVMTRDVVTVEPGTPVEAIARQMVDHQISGLPVVEPSGRMVGMVTDGDLYRRTELATERHRFSPSYSALRRLVGTLIAGRG